MNNQQPNTQTPQGAQQTGQMPDHRIDEISAELKRLRDENNQLRGQIDYISRAKEPGQKTPEKAPSPFDPKVDEALNHKFQAMMSEVIDPLKNQLTQQIGYVVDKNDELSYRLNYGSDRYEKFHSKVDALREEYQRKGQYIPREEALRIVYFEETGRKAQTEPPKTQEQQAPKYDPYFGTTVDPQTGMPVQGQAQQIDDWGNPIEPENQHQQDSHQVPTQPPAQWQQQRPAPQPNGFAPQANTNHPYTNPHSAPPQLPQQGLNSATPGNPEGSGRVNLDLTSSDEQLQAFEKQFGDIPL